MQATKNHEYAPQPRFPFLATHILVLCHAKTAPISACVKTRTRYQGHQISILLTILAVLKEIMTRKQFVVVEQHCEGKG